MILAFNIFNQLKPWQVTRSSVEHERAGSVPVSYIAYSYITSKYYFRNLVMRITQISYLSGLVYY